MTTPRDKNATATESCSVSIITPCHNAEPFIAEAIASARAQTFTDWEMLVVDDASADASAAIVADCAALDKRIRLLSPAAQNDAKPIGVAKARNFAIRQARGRYIAFLDADDVWFADKLAKQIAFMAAHDLAFTYASYRLIDARGRDLGAFITAPAITYAALLKTNRIGCLTAIYDARKLGKMELPDLAMRNDYALWLAILKRIGGAKGLLDPLAAYRIKNATLSGNKLRAAAWQWRVYRRCEKLGPLAGAYYFCHYAAHGLLKYPWRAQAQRWFGGLGRAGKIVARPGNCGGGGGGEYAPAWCAA